MDRRRGTGEIVDRIDLHVERKADVVPHELEARMPGEVVDIAIVTREQVVDAQNLVAALDQQIDKM
jgi:hypothetical protein